MSLTLPNIIQPGDGFAVRVLRPEKKRIADLTKKCNDHRRIVAVCCPELGEFIQ